MIQNSPKEVETFRNFAEKALHFETTTEKKIEELNENYKKLKELNLIEKLKE